VLLLLYCCIVVLLCCIILLYSIVVVPVFILSLGVTDLRLDAATLAIFGSTVGVKLLMWIYCSFYQKKSSSVHALATDHRMDVVFNTFACAFYLLG
jgi:hypothetical protein